MITKTVNGVDVVIRTDDEVIQYVGDEFKRAESLPYDESIEVRKRAKLIFDKRFPNPMQCPACRRSLQL